MRARRHEQRVEEIRVAIERRVAGVERDRRSGWRRSSATPPGRRCGRWSSRSRCSRRWRHALHVLAAGREVDDQRVGGRRRDRTPIDVRPLDRRRRSSRESSAAGRSAGSLMRAARARRRRAECRDQGRQFERTAMAGNSMRQQRATTHEEAHGRQLLGSGIRDRDSGTSRPDEPRTATVRPRTVGPADLEPRPRRAHSYRSASTGCTLAARRAGM